MTQMLDYLTRMLTLSLKKKKAYEHTWNPKWEEIDENLYKESIGNTVYKMKMKIGCVLSGRAFV